MLSTFKGLNRLVFNSSLCAKKTLKTVPVFVNDSESYRKGLRLKGFGYEDKLEKRGFLPRDPSEKKPLRSLPAYQPKDRWTPRRALFGQNDYIDILGDGYARPTDSMRGVPAWLRGFQGNEYQMLLLKNQRYAHWKVLRPQKYKEMRLRIQWLYRRLNYKTPT